MQSFNDSVCAIINTIDMSNKKTEVVLTLVKYCSAKSFNLNTLSFYRQFVLLFA